MKWANVPVQLFMKLTRQRKLSSTTRQLRSACGSFSASNVVMLHTVSGAQIRCENNNYSWISFIEL